MFFIVWRGFGLLVPVIAFVCFAACSMLFGHLLPEPGVNFVGCLAAGAALIAAGLYFKGMNKSRHLYWIPMEYWSILTGVSALAQIPRMFGH